MLVCGEAWFACRNSTMMREMATMNPETLTLLTFLGRAAVSFYFLWSASLNIIRFARNVEDLARAGIRRGGAVLVGAGTIAMTVASLLFLNPATVVQGGVGLILFTLGSDLLFHRWWIYRDPNLRTVHQQFACEHLALSGGIVGLMVAG